MQKSYYTDLVDRQKKWHLVDIYPDEGISGTSLKNRDQFKRMIDDCLGGKRGINLIVVKSVSRFARNVGDFSNTLKKLADLNPPIGVYFEMENLHSLNTNHEFSINVMASMAQDESRNKSSLMERSIEIRFKNGVFLTPELLGYDLDGDGILVINEDEAKTVRLIFYMYLFGYTCAKIAEILTDLERMTKRGNTTWATGSILQILQNERYCGDIIARKTFTRDYKEHTKRKNIINPETQKFYRNKYSKQDHHAPIISRDDFIAVQRLIANAKYGGNKGFLPQLKVITDGALQGFVSLNPRWAAFHAENYRAAAASAYNGEELPDRQIEVEAQTGDFDFRGYEIVRTQFFNTANKQCVTFSTKHLWFSSDCIRKFADAQYVEVLINPIESLMAVRPCAKEFRNALHWARIENGKYCSRPMAGSAFLRTIYKIFGWDTAYKYRVRGIRRQKGNESVIVFDMLETEVFIPKDIIAESVSIPDKPISSCAKNEIAYPQTLSVGFGQEYYRQLQAREIAAIDIDGKWDISEEGQTFCDELLNTTDEKELADSIKNLITDIQGEPSDDGK